MSELFKEEYFILAGGGPDGPRFYEDDELITSRPSIARRFESEEEAAAKIPVMRGVDPSRHWHVLRVRGLHLIED